MPVLRWFVNRGDRSFQPVALERGGERWIGDALTAFHPGDDLMGGVEELHVATDRVIGRLDDLDHDPHAFTRERPPVLAIPRDRTGQARFAPQLLRPQDDCLQRGIESQRIGDPSAAERFFHPRPRRGGRAGIDNDPVFRTRFDGGDPLQLRPMEQPRGVGRGHVERVAARRDMQRG